MNAASQPRTLQAEVDAIADEFRASVVVSSRDLKSWAASPQGSYIDEVRKKSLIERATPADSRSYVESFDLDAAREPFIMRENLGMGVVARVCVPIRSGNASAFVWLIPSDGDVDALLERVSVTRLERRLTETLIAGAWGEFQSMSSTSLTLMADLISGSVEDALRLVAERLGVASNGEIGAVLLVAEPQVGLSKHVPHMGTELAAGTRIIWSPVGDFMLVLCERRALDSLAHRAAELLRAALGSRQLSCGVGRLVASVSEGWSARFLEDMQYAATVSSIPFAHRPVASVDELGHWRHYRRLPWTAESLALVSPPVYQLSQRENADWLNTLEVFLDTNGDISECCDRLHIHRTTLHYRMGRIREVVGDSLDTGSGRADLVAGFAILSLMETPLNISGPVTLRSAQLDRS